MKCVLVAQNSWQIDRPVAVERIRFYKSRSLPIEK